MDKSNQKDYMATISWNRLSCGAPQAMFGSEIKTDSPVCIRISRAYVDHKLDSTHIGGRICAEFQPMLEIEMTPIQWAEFLTAGNIDGGVPCTITRIDGKPTEKVEMRNIAEDYNVQTELTFDKFKNNISDLEKYVQDIMQSGKPMGKAQMSELIRQLQIVRSNTVENVKYVKHCFKEDMATMVVKAKAEVNAYAELRLQNLGVKCLMDENNSEVTPKIQ